MANSKQKDNGKKISENKKKVDEKKSETMKQIENLEKALANIQNEEDSLLASGETKDEALVENENVDFGKEVKEIFSDTEPSEEIKEEIKDFEDSQGDFEKKLDENPEKAAEIVQEEIKKMETLKGKVETLRKNFNKATDRNIRNEGFTNWWNGSSGLY
jgi:hypothetical protein